jgi:hypothetical protein
VIARTECDRCRGNHRFAHTCGKQRQRSAPVLTAQRCTRQRLGSSSADAIGTSEARAPGRTSRGSDLSQRPKGAAAARMPTSSATPDLEKKRDGQNTDEVGKITRDLMNEDRIQRLTSPDNSRTSSAVAMSLERWGCCGDPNTWSFKHLEEQLTIATGEATRYLGDCWMIYTIMLERQSKARSVRGEPGAHRSDVFAERRAKQGRWITARVGKAMQGFGGGCARMAGGRFGASV